MRDIIYIVEEDIIDQMDCVVNVASYVGNVVTVCSHKWARTGTTVTDELSNTYTVVSVDYDTNEVELLPNGAWNFSGDSYTLTKPYFFTGTPLATNKEWSNFNADERNKVPFSWLVEPTSETFKSVEDTLERESTLLIVFLDSNNVSQWITTETHANRLQALYNMVQEFVDTIKREALFYSDNLEYNTKNFTKFGRETSSGVENNIIDANLTGVELRLTLPVNKTTSCEC